MSALATFLLRGKLNNLLLKLIPGCSETQDYFHNESIQTSKELCPWQYSVVTIVTRFLALIAWSGPMSRTARADRTLFLAISNLLQGLSYPEVS